MQSIFFVTPVANTNTLLTSWELHWWS